MLHILPMSKDAFRVLTMGFAYMPFNHSAQRLALARVVNALQLDQFCIAARGKLLWGIQDVRNAIGHASSEVLPGLTEHHNHTTGHILAAMIAHTFDNGNRSTVTHSKALAGSPGGKELSPCRTIQDGVPQD